MEGRTGRDAAGRFPGQLDDRVSDKESLAGAMKHRGLCIQARDCKLRGREHLLLKVCSPWRVRVV